MGINPSPSFLLFFTSIFVFNATSLHFLPMKILILTKKNINMYIVDEELMSYILSY